MVTYSKFLSTFLLLIFLSAIAIGETVQAADEPLSNFRTEFNEGLELLKKHQYKKAVAKFTVSIAENAIGDKQQALALYHRGLAYQALGQLDKARGDYSRAIKLQALGDKTINVAYYNRGLVHDGLNRPTAALADFVSAIEKNPDFSPAYHNLGNVLRKMGKHKRAIKNFVKSLKLGNPHPYLTYLGLAMAYDAIGRKEQAITSLKYALNLQPRFQQAVEMLARLTTEDLYTFPTKTASTLDTSPTVTASIPKNAATGQPVLTDTRVISDFERLDMKLRGMVKVEPQPVTFKKLALRGTLTTSSPGSVALLVPGPGFRKAQQGRRTLSLPKKKPQRAHYKVQLGTSKNSDKARKIWFFLRAQHADLLKNLNPSFPRINLGDRGYLYRIQVGPFKTRQAANRLCNIIKERAVNCFLV